jgi:hypothetical protein
MSGSDNELTGQLSGIKKMEVAAEASENQPLIRAENLVLNIERFSALSTELTSVLTRLAQDIRAAAQQLEGIRAQVDAKKKELKTLHGIEATAVALERLALDHQRQKETLERAIAEERALWEEEKAKRAQEERECQESLRIRHEREEEAFRQQWANERLTAQHKLEEELQLMRQDSLEKQQTMERTCLERELKLREKEVEWAQLIQELEGFMSRLSRRMRPESDETADVSEPQPSPAQSELIESHKATVTSMLEMRLLHAQRTENLKG